MIFYKTDQRLYLGMLNVSHLIFANIKKIIRWTVKAGNFFTNILTM